MKKIALIFALVLTSSLAADAVAEKVKVMVSGATREVDAFHKEEVTYFSFSELVEILGGSLDWKTVGHRISYVSDTNRMEFVPGSPYFKCNDSAYNMTYPAELKKGQLYLPAESFLLFLDRVEYQKISWEKSNRAIRVESEYFNVTDLSIDAKANGLLIEIFLTAAMPYDIFVTEGNWINVSIRDGLINRNRIASRNNPRILYDLKVHQIEGAGQVSLRLKRPVEKWSHKIQNDPPRIQISVADVNFEMGPADTSPQFGPDDKIDVIVIDAGHGGSQYGAIGPRGLREKDVALDIAKELAKLIRKDKQLKVIMTRDRDETVTLQQRADIANKAAPDLFISVHANSSPKKQVRGWNVFFLAQAKNDSARAVAQFENSSFLREQPIADKDADQIDMPALYEDPVLGILNEMIMTEFQAESHDFAMMVDREFRRDLDVPARGVDQAGFYVLNMVFAPSVLLEVGFISNEIEEKLIKDKKYHKNVAEATYEAIKRFKAKYEGR